MCDCVDVFFCFVDLAVLILREAECAELRVLSTVEVYDASR